MGKQMQLAHAYRWKQAVCTIVRFTMTETRKCPTFTYLEWQINLWFPVRRQRQARRQEMEIWGGMEDNRLFLSQFFSISFCEPAPLFSSQDIFTMEKKGRHKSSLLQLTPLNGRMEKFPLAPQKVYSPLSKTFVRNYNFVWGLQFPDSSLFFPPPPGKAANYRNKKTIIRGELRWAA